MPSDAPFGGLALVVPEVPPVRDLDGLRRTDSVCRRVWRGLTRGRPQPPRRGHSSVGSQFPCRPNGTRTGIRTRATGPEPGSSAGITSSQLLSSVRSVAYVIQ